MLVWVACTGRPKRFSSSASERRSSACFSAAVSACPGEVAVADERCERSASSEGRSRGWPRAIMIVCQVAVQRPLFVVRYS